MTKLVLPDRISVVTDTREKRYMTWPSDFYFEVDGRDRYLPVDKKVRTLEWGDYAIEGYEHITAVERKGSWREIFQNTCTKDARRFERCAERLAERTMFPILFLDFPVHRMSGSQFRSDHDGWRAFQRLVRLCCQKKIQILWLPAKISGVRIRAGEAIVQMMWTIIVEHLKGATHDRE